MAFPAPAVRDPLATLNFEYLAKLIHVGIGSPNGKVVASPPALYLNQSGGASTTLYVKESGVATSTGWVAK